MAGVGQKQEDFGGSEANGEEGGMEKLGEDHDKEARVWYSRDSREDGTRIWTDE